MITLSLTVWELLVVPGSAAKQSRGSGWRLHAESEMPHQLEASGEQLFTYVLCYASLYCLPIFFFHEKYVLLKLGFIF